jgi:hypothetical protein
MKVPELKGNQMITIAYMIGIIVALYIVYKILNSVGLLKTPADKRADEVKQAAVAAIRVEEYFDPDYYSDKSFHSLDVDTAIKYAKDLRTAMQGFGTDEESIYTIFGNLPSKTSVSQLAWYYKRQYGFPFYIMSDNLRVDLLNELTPAEVQTLMDIINKLPNT